jgi:predicted TIM-barrel fold metal-dependent hydrolase
MRRPLNAETARTYTVLDETGRGLRTLLDLPVIDGHIHLNHLERMDDVLALLNAGALRRANLVCTPNPGPINHNPALIAFKAIHPLRAYISGALDYSRVLDDRAGMSHLLADQVRRLKAIGFDGVKMTEGKPTKRAYIPIPLDAPEYEGLWATLEELQMPVLLHAGDPTIFWDPERCPPRARARGWFYGGGDYPLKEELHAEVANVLARRPRLRMVLAHFHFLAGDLARAARLLDAYPGICLDLAPGSEMYNHFTRGNGQARAFFLRYADRLIYGTDTTTGGMMAIRAQAGEPIAWALGRAWAVRTFLETEVAFTPPPELDHWLQPDLAALRGLALPREALARIYAGNLERVYGPVPAELDREAGLALVREMADVLDNRAGAKSMPNHARQALELLA